MDGPAEAQESAKERAEKLLCLARGWFPDLTPAEQTFLRKTAAGELADFSAESEEDNKPSEAGNWGEDRRLRSKVIAWLCTDPEASALVTHRGINMTGARIDGHLDLSFARMPFPLAVGRSSLPDGICLQYVRMRALSLRGSHAGPINADRMKVDGDVFLDEKFEGDGEVCLLGAEIGGLLSCSNGRFTKAEEKPDDFALNADMMKVGGSVFLNEKFEAKGGVRLGGAEIGGQLSCRNGHFSNPKDKPEDKPEDKPKDEAKDEPDGFALSADGMKVGCDVFLDEKFEAEGEVRLVGAEIGGQLTCSNGHFSNPKDKPDGFAFNADRMKVGGSVFLDKGFKA